MDLLKRQTRSAPLSQRALRLLTYASGFCFLGAWTCVIFGVVVEQLTNSGVLHDQNLWALSHPSYWVWFAVWTVEGAAGITLSRLVRAAMPNHVTTEPDGIGPCRLCDGT